LSILVHLFQPEEKKKSVVKTIKENETEEMRGIFISYIELNNYIKKIYDKVNNYFVYFSSSFLIINNLLFSYIA